MVVAEQNRPAESPSAKVKSLAEDFRGILQSPEKLEPHLVRLITRLQMANIRNNAVSSDDQEVVGVILLAERSREEVLELWKGLEELEGKEEFKPLSDLIRDRAGVGPGDNLDKSGL